MDQVIKEAEAFLTRMNNALSQHKTELERLKGSMVTGNGVVLSTYAQEAAQRFVTVQAFEIKVKEAEDLLKEAKEDFPRREEFRKKANDFEATAQKFDERAIVLREQLGKIELEAMALRSKAQEARNLTTVTAQTLQRRDAQQAEKNRKDLEQKRWRASEDVRCAKYRLKDAEEKRLPAEVLERRRTELSNAEKEFVTYANAT